MAAQFIPGLMAMGRGIASGARALPGLINRNKGRSAAVAGAGLLGGGTLYGLMSPDNENEQTSQQPPLYFDDPLSERRNPNPDNFTSTMPLRSEVLQEQYDRNIKRIQNIRLRSAILKAHNPQAKDDYEKNSLDMLKVEMEAEGDIRNAKLLEGIRNKNGSLPDNSKVIFDRLIKSGADVGFAGAVSGYQAKIEEAQAKQIAAVMKNQPDEKDAANTDVIVSRAVEGYRSGNSKRVNEAIEDITRLILRNEIDISARYGYGPETQGPENARKIAMDILAAGSGSMDTLMQSSSSNIADEIQISPE